MYDVDETCHWVKTYVTSDLNENNNWISQRGSTFQKLISSFDYIDSYFGILTERVHRLLKHKTNVDDEDDEDDDHYDSYDAGKGLRSTTVPQSNGGGGGGNMIAT